MHECWHNMFTYGKYKRMDVETSKHDELWTTRRRVTINVESLTWNVDDGDHWWDADWLATMSAVPLPTGRSHDDWRRSLRTPRMTATVTVMTYATTCHREYVHWTVMHGWCTCTQPRTRTLIILVRELDDHAYTVAITVWLNLSRRIFAEGEQNRRNKTYHSNPGTISNRWVQNVPWWSTENTRKLRKTSEQHTCVRLPQRRHTRVPGCQKLQMTA